MNAKTVRAAFAALCVLPSLLASAQERPLTADRIVIQASPPCYGSGCTNSNPQSTGCSNPANGSVYVLQSANIYYNGQLVGAVEMKYSAWCNARWAKTYSYVGNVCIGAQMLTSGGAPVSYQTNTYLCGQSDVYSNMYGGAAGKAKGYLYVTSNTNSYAQAITNAQ